MHPISEILITIADYIRYATSRFNAAGLSFSHGFESALDEASFLVLHSLHLPHDMPPAYGNAKLLPDERAALLDKIETRLHGKPLAYITGEAWFAGRAFFVNEHVLIPRSPIAELIEQSFAPWLTQPPDRVLDLCTGSGCIAVALAVQFPDAEVTATDISQEALAVAQRNIDAHGGR
jgi:ribosomal protein L3 glutamine methyltransferase